MSSGKLCSREHPSQTQCAQKSAPRQSCWGDWASVASRLTQPMELVTRLHVPVSVARALTIQILSLPGLCSVPVGPAAACNLKSMSTHAWPPAPPCSGCFCPALGFPGPHSVGLVASFGFGELNQILGWECDSENLRI